MTRRKKHLKNNFTPHVIVAILILAVVGFVSRVSRLLRNIGYFIKNIVNLWIFL